ncbi:hypothetical protein DXG01_004460, partial [Tephrocybe rancida]
MSDSVLDLTRTPLPFDKRDWIGIGKVYPTTNVPDEVQCKKEEMLSIPDAHIEFFPNPALPVKQFIALALPMQSSEIISIKVKKWYSTQTPNASIDILLNRTIPPKTFLDDLADGFGQAWFDGAQSIVDPRYNNGIDHFPLWVVTLWRRLADVSKKQAVWRNSFEWLEDEIALTRDIPTCETLRAAQDLLETLSWNTPLQYSRGIPKTFELALLLSSAWLSDEHINMIAQELSKEVLSIPEIAHRVIVAPLTFSAEILSTAKGKSYLPRNAPLLCRYVKHIKDQGTEEIYFPLHIGGNHWITGFLNLKQEEVSYGDPKGSKKTIPKLFHKALLQWLQVVFNKHFKCSGNTLPCGEQDDTFSCGVIFGNTVNHAISGVPLWEQRRSVEERVNWFLRLALEGGTQENVAIEEEEAIPLAAVSVALGDHNFPDLHQFALEAAAESTTMPHDESTVQRSRRSLFDLMNPIPPTNYAIHPQDIDMHAPNVFDSVVAPTESEVPLSKPKFTGVGKEHKDCDKLDVPDGKCMDVKMNEGHRNGAELKRKWDSDTSSSSESDFDSATDLEVDTEIDTEIDTDPDTDYESRKPVRHLGSRPKDTLSISGKANREVRDAVKKGTFELDDKKYNNWKTKVLKEDPKAEFSHTNIRLTRHSVCGGQLLMKAPYDMTRWKEHLKLCKSKKPMARRKAASMPTLTSLGWFVENAVPRVAKKVKVQKMCPCPGITEADDQRVPQYLRRTPVAGGGARSVKLIAGEMFKQLFSCLTPKEKQQIFTAQRHEQQWKNDHENLRVFATACKHSVPEPEPEPEVKAGPKPSPKPGTKTSKTAQRVFPCKACTGVLRSRAFKVAIQKKPKDQRNYIYTNHRFRTPILGQIYARVLGLKELIETPDAKRTPCVRYAQGVLKGEYDNKVFAGLVEAIVVDHDRTQRGVGRQNFKYAPPWDELCHILKIHCPRLYVTLSEHFPMPAIRTFRAKEARQPRFPTVIEDRNFELVVEHVTSVNYSGPVGSSCDDTKLFSSLRLYWDSNEKCYFLIGGTDGPHRVLDPDDVKQVLAEGKITKATKVRLWTLTLPAPNIPPVLVAVLPIPNDTKAEALLVHSEKILIGLINRGITVISYACDGTEVERSVQRMLVAKSEPITKLIRSPRAGCPDTSVTFIRYHGQVMTVIQDSKHALKTFRNNLFSGAHLLALGNFTALYEHIHQLANEKNTPIYKRDVEKLDRQDDNAASRLFSADVLAFIADHHPDWVGEIVYLFIFGELIDAYQNRSIPHVERLKLVLRARYFLDSWAKYLEVAGYARSKYFLSREAVDIARIIIEGYISLLYIHRDYLPSTYPLLPWLHSTEACEHAFGEARKIIKDFTLLDFIYMVPKLRIKIREAVLRARGSDAKERAAGYNHTYVDHSGINISNLSTFPTDREIAQVASEAAQEADSLLVLLGLSPKELHHARATFALDITLPSIDGWYPLLHKQDDSTSPELDSDDEFVDTDTESLSEAQELQELINREENKKLTRTKKQEDRTMNLTCAAMAVTADETMKVQFMADIPEEEEQELLAQEQQEIEDLIAVLPALRAPDEPAQPLGRGNIDFDSLDFHALINMRREHQTKYAATGVRTWKDTGNDNEHSSDGIPKESIRRKLIREFHEALKEGQDAQAVGTGVERSARWLEGSSTKTSGNAANAAAAAETVAKKEAARRRRILTQAKVPCLTDVCDGRVSILKPLQLGSYGIFFNNDQLVVGHIIALYSKTGGKYGKHGSVVNATNVSAVSHISVELFDQLHGRQFRGTSTTLQTKRVAL